MADQEPMFLAGDFEIGRGGLAAALAMVAGGERPMLLRWPGAIVSPFAADFVAAALSTLAQHPAIAGVSLAVPRLRRAMPAPFVSIEDGFDTIFLQAVPEAALVLTPDQAGRAADGLARHDGDLAAYNAATGSYFVAPRTALAHDGRDDPCQHRLFPVGRRAWRISSPETALALYDSRLEIAGDAVRRMSPALANHDFTVDLWGERPRADIGNGLMLSARPCRAAILQFALEFTPPEANLAAPVADGFFALGKATDFEALGSARRERLFRHATRFNAMGDYAHQLAAPLRRLLSGARR